MSLLTIALDMRIGTNFYDPWHIAPVRGDTVCAPPSVCDPNADSLWSMVYDYSQVMDDYMQMHRPTPIGIQMTSYYTIDFTLIYATYRGRLGDTLVGVSQVCTKKKIFLTYTPTREVPHLRVQFLHILNDMFNVYKKAYDSGSVFEM